jgi:hypothetical protein
MLGSEFEAYFNNFSELKRYFLGVFSIDTLPKKIKTHYFLICNTSPSNTDGKHWFCVVKTEANYIELFDSLGVNGDKEVFYKKTCCSPKNF